MKRTTFILTLLLALPAFAAEEDALDLNQCKDRLSLSARFGFNIDAKFGPRTTPDGLAYSHLDGYVLMDSTGNFDPTSTFPGGITQNWGYDNSSRQRDGTSPFGGYPTTTMTRLASGDPATKKMDDDPAIGGELVYARRLYKKNKWHFGVEGAANFTPVDLRESSVTTGAGIQDSYQYFNGTTLPDSPGPDGQPFQGTFAGAPQYALISATPVNPTAVPVSVASKTKFDADIWGFRVGPYAEYQLHRRWAVNVCGGLAVALVDADASWRQTVTVNGVTDPTHSGSDSDSDVMWGWYVGANVTYHIHRRWDLNAGVQYQDVGTFDLDAGARRAELDLSKSLFVTVGVSCRF